MGLCCCKTNPNKADSSKNEEVLRKIKGSNNEGFNKGSGFKNIITSSRFTFTIILVIINHKIKLLLYSNLVMNLIVSCKIAEQLRSYSNVLLAINLVMS